MNSMTKLALATCLLFQTPLLLKADMDKKDWNPQKMDEMRQKKDDERIGKMTKELNLSPEQATSVKSIMKEQGDKMMTLHKEMGDKMKSLHDETDGKVEALLTAEQKTKFAALKEEMKKEHKEHKEHHEKEGEKKPKN